MKYFFVRLEKQKDKTFSQQMKDDLYPEYIRNFYDLLEK